MRDGMWRRNHERDGSILTDDVITYELRPKGYKTFQNARNIKQLDANFSRLYSTQKEYDLLRQRTRINGKLKPLGVKHYFCPDESPEGIIKETIEIHKRKDFYVACSGGKDSICLAHYISTHHPDKFKGLVFIDTGVGISKTREWLKDYAKEMGWKLYIIKPNPPDAYTNIVLKFGFPGAGYHNIVMRVLKYVTLRTFAFDPVRKSTTCIISGTRKFESKRRAINTRPINKDGLFYFSSPFYTKTDEETYAYLLKHGLKRTPIHDVLGMSGECMCGCYADVNEREIIRQQDPELDQYITWLEEQVQVRGTDRAKKSPVWGKGRYTKKKKQVVNPDIEAVICGTECGGGTMRGVENY